MLEKILEWDRSTFIYLNNLGIEEYDGLWNGITTFSNWTPLFIAVGLLLLLKYPRKNAIGMLLTFGLMLLVVTAAMYFTKEWVQRLRPNNDETINLLIRMVRRPSDYSFFSGHAATSFSITTLAVLYLKDKFKPIWLMYIWPLLFSFSRIYVGVHYPTDLIVGCLVGVTLALLTHKLYVRVIAPYLASVRPL